jgi:hypothetical protein
VRGAAASIGFAALFFLCFSLLGFLVMASSGVSSFRVSLSFFSYPEICIYSVRVPSRVRNQVSIKLILFFEV